MRKFWFLRFTVCHPFPDKLTITHTTGNAVVATFNTDMFLPWPVIQWLEKKFVEDLSKRKPVDPRDVMVIVDFYAEISQEGATQFGLDPKNEDPFFLRYNTTAFQMSLEAGLKIP